WLARPVANGDRPLSLADDSPRLDARQLGTEAHHLRLRGRAWRVPQTAEVDHLDQRGLARTVGPDHAHQPSRRSRLHLGVAAKVDAAHCRDPHARPARYDGRRIGMIRYQNEPSSPCSNPGRSALISFIRTVSPSTLSTPSRRKSGLNPISSRSPWKSTGIDSRASPTSCVCAARVSDPSSKL